MIVVADSSPLIVLSSLDHLALLPKLFGQVVAPEEVRAELASSRRSEAVQALASTPPSWLEFRQPQLRQSIPRLHAGEQAAINLATELRADLLLIDEADGRREALQRQLRVTGTVGLLERAAEQKLLDLRETFTRLKATDFWVSEELLDQRLRAFELRMGTGLRHRPKL